MEVKFEVKLDCKRSQLTFGELQTAIQVKLVNAEEITRRTGGAVFFERDDRGEFIVENTKAVLDCEIGSWTLRCRIREKLFEKARERAIEKKRKEITIDANEVMEEVRKEMEMEKLETVIKALETVIKAKKVKVIAEVKYADQCTVMTQIEDPTIQRCEKCNAIIFSHTCYERCPSCFEVLTK